MGDRERDLLGCCGIDSRHVSAAVSDIDKVGYAHLKRHRQKG